MQAYYILDEVLIAGELQETSKKSVARVIAAQVCFYSFSLFSPEAEQSSSYLCFVLSYHSKFTVLLFNGLEEFGLLLQ